MFYKIIYLRWRNDRWWWLYKLMTRRNWISIIITRWWWLLIIYWKHHHSWWWGRDRWFKIRWIWWWCIITITIRIWWIRPIRWTISIKWRCHVWLILIFCRMNIYTLIYICFSSLSYTNQIDIRWEMWLFNARKH